MSSVENLLEDVEVRASRLLARLSELRHKVKADLRETGEHSLAEHVRNSLTPALTNALSTGVVSPLSLVDLLRVPVPYSGPSSSPRRGTSPTHAPPVNPPHDHAAPPALAHSTFALSLRPSTAGDSHRLRNSAATGALPPSVVAKWLRRAAPPQGDHRRAAATAAYTDAVTSAVHTYWSSHSEQPAPARRPAAPRGPPTYANATVSSAAAAAPPRGGGHWRASRGYSSGLPRADGAARDEAAAPPAPSHDNHRRTESHDGDVHSDRDGDPVMDRDPHAIRGAADGEHGGDSDSDRSVDTDSGSARSSDGAISGGAAGSLPHPPQPPPAAEDAAAGDGDGDAVRASARSALRGGPAAADPLSSTHASAEAAVCDWLLRDALGAVARHGAAVGASQSSPAGAAAAVVGGGGHGAAAAGGAAGDTSAGGGDDEDADPIGAACELMVAEYIAEYEAGMAASRAARAARSAATTAAQRGSRTPSPATGGATAAVADTHAGRTALAGTAAASRDSESDTRRSAHAADGAGAGLSAVDAPVHSARGEPVVDVRASARSALAAMGRDEDGGAPLSTTHASAEAAVCDWLLRDALGAVARHGEALTHAKAGGGTALFGAAAGGGAASAAQAMSAACDWMMADFVAEWEAAEARRTEAAEADRNIQRIRAAAVAEAAAHHAAVAARAGTAVPALQTVPAAPDLPPLPPIHAAPATPPTSAKVSPPSAPAAVRRESTKSMSPSRNSFVSARSDASDAAGVGGRSTLSRADKDAGAEAVMNTTAEADIADDAAEEGAIEDIGTRGEGEGAETGHDAAGAARSVRSHVDQAADDQADVDKSNVDPDSTADAATANDDDDDYAFFAALARTPVPPPDAPTAIPTDPHAALAMFLGGATMDRLRRSGVAMSVGAPAGGMAAMMGGGIGTGGGGSAPAALAATGATQSTPAAPDTDAPTSTGPAARGADVGGGGIDALLRRVDALGDSSGSALASAVLRGSAGREHDGHGDGLFDSAEDAPRDADHQHDGPDDVVIHRSAVARSYPGSAHRAGTSGSGDQSRTRASADGADGVVANGRPGDRGSAAPSVSPPRSGWGRGVDVDELLAAAAAALPSADALARLGMTIGGYAGGDHDNGDHGGRRRSNGDGRGGRDETTRTPSGAPANPQPRGASAASATDGCASAVPHRATATIPDNEDGPDAWTPPPSAAPGAAATVRASSAIVASPSPGPHARDARDVRQLTPSPTPTVADAPPPPPPPHAPRAHPALSSSMRSSAAALPPVVQPAPHDAYVYSATRGGSLSPPPATAAAAAGLHGRLQGASRTPSPPHPGDPRPPGYASALARVADARAARASQEPGPRGGGHTPSDRGSGSPLRAGGHSEAAAADAVAAPRAVSRDSAAHPRTPISLSTAIAATAAAAARSAAVRPEALVLRTRTPSTASLPTATGSPRGSPRGTPRRAASGARPPGGATAPTVASSAPPIAGGATPAVPHVYGAAPSAADALRKATDDAARRSAARAAASAAARTAAAMHRTHHRPTAVAAVIGAAIGGGGPDRLTSGPDGLAVPTMSTTPSTRAATAAPATSDRSDDDACYVGVSAATSRTRPETRGSADGFALTAPGSDRVRGSAHPTPGATETSTITAPLEAAATGDLAAPKAAPPNAPLTPRSVDWGSSKSSVVSSGWAGSEGEGA